MLLLNYFSIFAGDSVIFNPILMQIIVFLFVIHLILGVFIVCMLISYTSKGDKKEIKQNIVNDFFVDPLLIEKKL